MQRGQRGVPMGLHAAVQQGDAESWPQQGELEELDVSENDRMLQDVKNRSMGY